MRVVGVSVTAGVISVVTLQSAASTGLLATPVEGSSDRIERNTGLDEARQLVDLTHRVESYLASQRPEKVALARTRKFGTLSYTDAYARVTAVCAVMAACVACEVAFTEVSTEAIAARLEGVQAKALGNTPHTLFGYSARPPHWRNDGVAQAHGAAATQIPRSQPDADVGDDSSIDTGAGADGDGTDDRS
ncbi:hypothetical protein [uncultured Jatrophihabitans sp.]|uniref:hypothetical protein n=1 Tax=uncultured Jatrophihabitans sp. TaxID=1610747 RepID=UPI0035C9D1CA